MSVTLRLRNLLRYWKSFDVRLRLSPSRSVLEVRPTFLKICADILGKTRIHSANMNSKKQIKDFSGGGRKLDLKEQSVRGGLITMASQVIEMVLQIASIAILARLILPEHFGLISMVTALIAIATQFADLGLGQATIQSKDITHEQVSNLFWINATLGAVLTILVVAISPLIVSFYDDSRLGPIAIAISMNFLLGGLTIQHQALLRRRMQFTALAGIRVGSLIISTAAAVVLALRGYGYWALVWRELARGILLVVGTWMCCFWIPSLPIRNTTVGHLLNFAKHVTGFNLFVFATASLDQVLIGKFYGPGELGGYRQASQLIFSPIGQIYLAFCRVAEPALSGLQDDHDRYRKYFTKMLTVLSAGTMPLLMFVVIYAQDVVLVMLGENWVGVTEVLRICALAWFPMPGIEPTGLLLQTSGQARRYFKMGVVTSLARVCAFSVGAWWGALGVAYGQLALTCTVMIPRLYFCVRDTPLSPNIYWKAIVKPLQASVMMAVILSLWNEVAGMTAGATRVAIAIPVAVVAYILGWMVIPGGKVDLRELIGEILSGLRLVKTSQTEAKAGVV
jgi:O-antigen/teichoic acid export membrane protein